MLAAALLKTCSLKHAKELELAPGRVKSKLPLRSNPELSARGKNNFAAPNANRSSNSFLYFPYFLYFLHFLYFPGCMLQAL